MRELFTAAFKITSVFCLHGILNGTGDWIIHAQNFTLNELHLARSIAPQTVSCRCLSLTPCFRRAGLASGIWRWGTPRYAICSCSIFQARSRIMIIIAASVGVIVRRRCAGMIPGISLGQTVVRRRPHRRCMNAGMGIVKWTIQWAISSVMQKSAFGFVVGSISISWRYMVLLQPKG